MAPGVSATSWANLHRNAGLDLFFGMATRMAEWPVIVLSIGLWLYRDWFLAILGGIFYSLEGISVNVIKQLTHLPRPITENKYLIELPGYEIHSQLSFPSGHTAAAVFGFGLLACLSKKPATGIACALLAACTGYSRLYLGQHYLADVLAGAGLSLALIFIMLKMNPLFSTLKPLKK